MHSFLSQMHFIPRLSNKQKGHDISLSLNTLVSHVRINHFLRDIYTLLRIGS